MTEPPTSTPDDAELADELARLREERDAARAELEATRAELDSARPASRHLTRRVLTGVLVVVSCLSFLTGGIGIWASRSLLNTQVWVDHVGPLAQDPAVQSSISDELTTEVMRLVNPEQLFEEVLPERGKLLAGPLSGAVRGFVGDQVDDFVRSEAFARLWVAANREAHAAAVRVVRGDAPAVEAGDDSITLNLLPVVNRLLERITSESPELFGRTIDLPDVQVDEVPTAVIDKINQVFGSDLPEDFGQITIDDGGALKDVQDAVALFDRIVWLSVVLFVLSSVGALALSTDRRRTLLQAAIADVVLLIVMRRAAITAQNEVLDLVRVESNEPAVKAATDAVLQGLFDGTRLLLWGFGAVIVVAWLSGSSPRVVRIRERTASVVSTVLGAARDKGADPAVGAFLVAHRDALRIAGVVVAVAALWWLHLSWLGVFVVLAVLAAYVALLGRVGTHEEAITPPG